MKRRTPKGALDPESLDRAITAAAVGANLDYAAHVAGMSEETLREYLSDARDEWTARADGVVPRSKRLRERQDTLAEFYSRWVEAREKVKARLLQTIEDAGEDPKNWRASAWLLEQMYPEEFGKRSRRTPASPPAPIASPTPPASSYGKVVKLFEQK